MAPEHSDKNYSARDPLPSWAWVLIWLVGDIPLNIVWTSIAHHFHLKITANIGGLILVTAGFGIVIVLIYEAFRPGHSRL
jgi:hypothetical protein